MVLRDKESKKVTDFPVCAHLSHFNSTYFSFQCPAPRRPGGRLRPPGRLPRSRDWRSLSESNDGRRTAPPTFLHDASSVVGLIPSSGWHHRVIAAVHQHTCRASGIIAVRAATRQFGPSIWAPPAGGDGRGERRPQICISVRRLGRCLAKSF